MDEAAKYLIEVDSDIISVVDPSGMRQSIGISQLQAVYVETNDSGPWGLDVWYVLDATDGATCRFPLGASNENAILDELFKLPGFELKGMNSTENARFTCWKREVY